MALNLNSGFNGSIGPARFLGAASETKNKTLQRLSSGLRVNTASDGPAALVISELLRGQTAGLSTAIRNTQEASNTLGIAEGGLQGMSEQLRKMRELALHALNSGVTSPGQVSADQAELNGLIGSVGNIAATTRYASQSLLNGSRDFTFDVNDSSQLLDAGASRITSAADNVREVSVQFSGDAVDRAEKAQLETSLGGGPTLAEAQEFSITGAQGARSFSFAAGTSVQEVADQINAATGSTGVQAYAIKDTGSGATELRLTSQEYGSGQEIAVAQTAGDAFAAAGTSVRDAGQDVAVTVGGERVQGQGLTVEVATAEISGRLQLRDDGGAAQTGYDQDATVNPAAAATAKIEDIQGGMRLQLGEGGGEQNRTRFGLPSFDPSSLGRVSDGGRAYSLSDMLSGGAASLEKDPAKALQIIDQAITDVAAGRAQIGAYQANTLQANADSLAVALEETIQTESAIRDSDMASETTELIRARLLERAGLFGIQNGNITSKNVLRLLGG